MAYDLSLAFRIFFQKSYLQSYFLTPHKRLQSADGFLGSLALLPKKYIKQLKLGLSAFNPYYANIDLEMRRLSVCKSFFVSLQIRHY